MPPDLNIQLIVTEYSLRLYPLPNTPQENYANHAVGLAILANPAAGSLSVYVEFSPDGTSFPQASYDPAANRVLMYMSASQWLPFVDLLRSGTEILAIYSSQAGVVYADVEGSFIRA